MSALLVATADGLHRIGSAEEVDHAGRVVTALGGSGDDVWAIVDGKEVWRGRDRLHMSEDVRLNCVSPDRSGALIGTSEAHLARISDGGWAVVDGFEAAPGRAEWYTPWGGPPDVRSIATGDGSLLVNVHVGGILRSVDAGETWQQTIDIHRDVHQVITHERLILAAAATGLAVSGDGGEAWEFDDEGLHASYCRAVTVCDGHVLLSACVGPHGGRAAIYRKALGSEEPFRKCEVGLPEWFGDNIDTDCLVASGPSAAFGTNEGAVFLSEDGGDTWQQTASDLAPVRGLLFG